MEELTLVLDCFGHKELKEYLMSLKGIIEVIIKNEDNLEIYIKYNSNLITSKILKSEIFLFLDVSKTPSIIAFNKHASEELLKYSINNESIHCCDYCLKGIIEDLFEVNGIEEVNCNYFEVDHLCNLKESVIEVNYNPNIISVEDIKNFESKL